MKTRLSIIVGSLFLFSQIGTVMAQAVPLTVSATVPAATGLQLTVTPVNSTTNVFGTSSTTATTIPFGTLTFSSSLGIYLPTNYYAIDIGTTGGAGTPTVSVTYAEGTGTNNPNGVATNGLGTKTTATFVTEAVSGSSTVETASSLGKKRLIDLTGTAGELTSIPSGSFERVYVGVWTGETTTAPVDPSNGKPFSNTDVGGTYQGVLTFTAVTL